MTIKENKTTRGGNIGFEMTRSKISKDKNGFGKVVSLARETLMQKLGYDPGKDIVAAHFKPGAHHSGKEVTAARWKKRSWNTAESNMNRDAGISATDKLKLKNYKSPVKEKKKLKDIIKKKK